MKTQEPEAMKPPKRSINLSEPYETSENFLGPISETKSQDDRNVRDFFEEMISGKNSSHPLERNQKNQNTPKQLIKIEANEVTPLSEEPVERIIITPRERKESMPSVKDDLNVDRQNSYKEKEKKVF